MDSASSEASRDSGPSDSSPSKPRRTRRRRTRRSDEPESPEAGDAAGSSTPPKRKRTRRKPRRRDDAEEPPKKPKTKARRGGSRRGGSKRDDEGGEARDGADAKPARPARRDGPEPEVHAVDVVFENIDEDALKVIRRLRRYGHRAYLVGGGVRDLLLGVKPKDFDIATDARPDEVRSLFRNCRIIGRRFRLAHILFAGGKVIETATFRRDPTEAFDQAEGEFKEEMEALQGGKHAVRRNEDVDLLIRHDNVFGEPHEDALRRDFTINGLFFDTEDRTVIDYVGGMADVDNRVVRTIGPPDVRFREDPVRILRAIKFSARLDLGIDPEVYDAMVAQRDELARAAKPRLIEEILRLLRGGAAHRSYWLMWETGALGVLLPQLAVHLDDDSRDARLLWARLSAIDTLKKAGALPSDPVLFAALMYGPILEAVGGAKDWMKAYESLMRDVLETLAVPRRMKERVRNVVQAQRRLAAGKLGTLPRRDYFDDAATLFAIDCDARGVRRPDWLDQRPKPSPDQRPRRRRRRRRRKR
ncbi:MAG TPA: polynucleotide adenylyltransferase PcnB [Sandaracinaceae bacterium LLY-WYZ-13_1]|nr:polynucleotide adenylyltransferase PcnB [Sandaracinaceae bacterium LLY-WYZ-13_1]